MPQNKKRRSSQKGRLKSVKRLLKNKEFRELLVEALRIIAECLKR